MGRQINFYMSESKQNLFLDFLREKQFVFLSCFGEKIENPNDCRCFYLYKEEFGEWYFRKNNVSLDTFESPVIEVTKTKIKDQKVYEGRLWVSDSFYKKNIGKLEYCKKYMNEYQILYRWIRKNVPYQNVIMGGYLFKTYADDEFVNIEDRGFKFTT